MSTDDEVMSRSAYAAHQKVAPNAVLRAVRSGRIARAAVYGAGGKIVGIRWRQADQLWQQNTDPIQAAKVRKQLGPAPAAPVQTSAPGGERAAPRISPPTLQRALSDLLARIFEPATVQWAADVAVRHDLSPEDAVDHVEGLLYFLNAAAEETLGLSSGQGYLTIPAILEAGTKRADVIGRVERAAEAFRLELER